MSDSLPSKRVAIADVPEVENFRATFVYNFFTPEESINDTSEAPASFRRLPAESFDAERINSARRVVPRLVRFDFSRVVFHPGSLWNNEFAQRPNPAGALNDISIKNNLSRVQSETDFSINEYVGLEFQDDNVDRKLFAIVSGSIAKRVAAKNRSITQGIDDARQSVIDNLKDEHSLLDAAKALADETSEGVSDNLVVSALNQIDALRLTFVNDDTQRAMINNTFARVRNVSVRGQVSSRIVGRVIKNVVDDPMSTFSDELAATSKHARSVQLRAVSRVNPGIIHMAEFQPEFDAIRHFPVDAHDFPASTKIVGYIIDKREAMADGTLRQHPPIIIENADVSTVADLNVAYGRTYVYTIRTVAQLKIKAHMDDADDVVIGVGLVSSRRSPRVYVTCVEEVPPPYVSDFNVVWDYTHDAPMLMWSFPTNPQRDIKQFQVFRRMSIDEPFELIKQYDFDDSRVRISSAETPDPLLVERVTSPVLTYLDTEFKKSWRAIYAVCSIDAHGLSSNYSVQHEVSFDTLKNRIVKRLVAFSGAPKSYPNMSLNNDLFVDTIKSSGHNRAKVYFDPEFLRLDDASGSDLGLLAFENVDGGKYRLQIINTDIMEQEVVDVVLRDMRPTGKK